jgi:hypothetical protein
MDDLFNFDEEIRKATAQHNDRVERERIAREKKLEEERIAREKKLEEERIAREKKLEEERIAREKRIHSNTVECEKQFTAQKQLWFEEMASKIRTHILNLISEGENEWEFRVQKNLSRHEIKVVKGYGPERISKSITVKEIYSELFDKLRERYIVRDQTVLKESLKGPHGSSCVKFVPTGGTTSMTCRCGLGRVEHTTVPPHIVSFTISRK